MCVAMQILPVPALLDYAPIWHIYFGEFIVHHFDFGEISFCHTPVFFMPYTIFICLVYKLGAFAMHAYQYIDNDSMFKSSVCLVDIYSRCIMTTVKALCIILSTRNCICILHGYV